MLSPQPILDKLAKLLPNLFIYSLFFTAWTWAIRNYRRHWHNFVVHENKSRSLLAFKEIVDNSGDPMPEAFRERAMELACLIVLSPNTSGYVPEEHEEQTGAERLVKMEEMVRDLITRRSK
ncbi:MAG: hypothetical protein GVY13_10350 [Alphaproteobacteria bacterium]|jgi:hypothetical protein|nr:hypothetical protein [Alphaproteobacteria bacterium]